MTPTCHTAVAASERLTSLEERIEARLAALEDRLERIEAHRPLPIAVPVHLIQEEPSLG